MGLPESMAERLTDRPPHVSRRSDPHGYASEAGQCARKIALRIWHSMQGPRSQAPEEQIRLSGLLALVIGEAVHGITQDALLKAYRNCRVEVPWDLDATSGRADAVYETHDGKLVVVEIKTKSPTAFKDFKTSNKPDMDNVLQAVLGAMALNACYVHIIYINKAARAFESPILEWIFPVTDELEEAGFLEESRLSRIVKDAQAGTIPQPMYHGELLANPDKHFWPCAFCAYKEHCKSMGPQAVVLTPVSAPALFTDDLLEEVYLASLEEEPA